MKRILVVAKQSKYEYEKEKFGLSHEQICEKYIGEHANLEAILASHDAQLSARKLFRQLMPEAEMVMMNEVREKIKGYDMAVSFGGDNSFTYLGHFLDEIPVVGMNSDPGRSVGALCMWSAKDLNEFVQRIRRGEYRIEEWTRLQAVVDGAEIERATTEYFVGEKLRKDMSRHVMVYHGREYEQKSSGLIVVSGAGSTGWYDSANKFLFPNGNRFPKTDKKGVFIVTEPYLYKSRGDGLYCGELLPGEELTLYSLNDGAGIVSVDCWHEHDFSRGKKAVIKISEQPLRTVVP